MQSAEYGNNDLILQSGHYLPTMELDEITVRHRRSDSHLQTWPSLPSEGGPDLGPDLGPNTETGDDSQRAPHIHKSVSDWQLLREHGHGEGKIQGDTHATEEQDTESDAIQALGTTRSILLLLGLSLGTFVVGLDNTIIGTCLSLTLPRASSLDVTHGWHGTTLAKR